LWVIGLKYRADRLFAIYIYIPINITFKSKYYKTILILIILLTSKEFLLAYLTCRRTRTSSTYRNGYRVLGMTILYYTILYYTVIYCTILYYTMLYYTTL
jgi:hypothetical protein